MPDTLSLHCLVLNIFMFLEIPFSSIPRKFAFVEQHGMSGERLTGRGPCGHFMTYRCFGQLSHSGDKGLDTALRRGLFSARFQGMHPVVSWVSSWWAGSREHGTAPERKPRSCCPGQSRPPEVCFPAPFCALIQFTCCITMGGHQRPYP